MVSLRSHSYGDLSLDDVVSLFRDESTPHASHGINKQPLAGGKSVSRSGSLEDFWQRWQVATVQLAADGMRDGMR
jgi:hypothetical protein